MGRHRQRQPQRDVRPRPPVPAIDLEDGQDINVSLVRPLLTFELGGHDGSAGHPPTSAVSSVPQPASSQPAAVGPAPRRTRSDIATGMRKIHWPGKSAEPPRDRSASAGPPTTTS